MSTPRNTGPRACECRAARVHRWGVVAEGRPELGLLLWALALCSADVSAAQDLQPFVPASLEYPDRAAAIRPTGMVELSASWAHGHTRYALGGFEEHLLVQSVEARVPYESLLVEVSWVGALEHYRIAEDDWEDTLLVYRVGNPRIGASFRDAGRGWRYEIGSAINLGWLHGEVLEYVMGPGRRSPSVVTPAPPHETHLFRHRSGWNWFQLAEGAVAWIAHGRVEVDPAPELVLGAELDLPIVAITRQGTVHVAPQVALEVAWRFLAHALLGVRAQLVAVPQWRDYAVITSIEPFVRVGYGGRDVGYYGLLAADVQLGPDRVWSEIDPTGSVALKLAGGVLF